MASGAIKGITIKLGADASELATALDKSEKSLRATQTQLNNVNKALKFNPNNVDLLRQKATLLEKKIKDNASSIKDMKSALAQMDAKGVDKTSQEYMDLERAIIEAESKQKAFNKELQDVQRMSTPIAQTGIKFQALGGKLEQVGQSMRGVSIAAGAVVAALGAMTYKAAQTADDLNTLSSQYVIATKDLQLYAAAADLVDVSVNDIAKSNAKMKKSMLTAQKGTGDAATAWKKLGVSIEDSNGNLRNQDEVFQETIAALGQMTNETERDALAMTIFGRNAAMLNPMIEDMGVTYKNVADTFKKNNIDIVDQKTLDRANAFNDKVDMIKATLSQALMVIGSKMSAYLLPIMEKLSNWFGILAGKIANMNPVILTIIGAIAGVIAATAPLLIFIGKISTGIGGLLMFLPKLTGILRPLFALLSANPFGAIAIALATLVTMFVAFGGNVDQLSAKITGTIQNVINGIVSKIPEITNVISTLIPKIVRSLVNNLPQIIEAGAKIILALVKGTIKSIPIIVKNMPKIVKAVLNGLKKIVSGVGSIGKNIVKGLWSGISDKFGWIVSKIKSFTNSIKNKLKSFFGIKSPSKWARDMIGKNIVLGMAKGITGNVNIVDEAMANLVPNLDSMSTSTAFKVDYANMYSVISRAFKDADFKIVMNGRELGRGLRGLGVAFNG